MNSNSSLTRPHLTHSGGRGLLYTATLFCVALMNGQGMAQQSDGNGATASSLSPILEVHPGYPDAAARGLSGEVRLAVTVTPHGTVETVRVLTAEPAGVFEQAATEAVSRWRYPQDLERPAQDVTVTLRFQPPRTEPAQVAARAAIALDRPASGPRNQCVRESAVYHYGDSIQVDLMNACGEPLLVFGCAQGTGRHTGRWVCVDGEQQRSLLVPPGDERLGSTVPVTTVEGDRAFTHNDTLHVTRAPNSQYWWVACPTSDAECRDIARHWTRSVNQQPARVNPQHRTALALARSH